MSGRPTRDRKPPKRFADEFAEDPKKPAPKKTKRAALKKAAPKKAAPKKAAAKETATSAAPSNGSELEQDDNDDDASNEEGDGGAAPKKTAPKQTKASKTRKKGKQAQQNDGANNEEDDGKAAPEEPAASGSRTGGKRKRLREEEPVEPENNDGDAEAAPKKSGTSGNADVEQPQNEEPAQNGGEPQVSNEPEVEQQPPNQVPPTTDGNLPQLIEEPLDNNQPLTATPPPPTHQENLIDPSSGPGPDDMGTPADITRTTQPASPPYVAQPTTSAPSPLYQTSTSPLVPQNSPSPTRPNAEPSSISLLSPDYHRDPDFTDIVGHPFDSIPPANQGTQQATPGERQSSEPAQPPPDSPTPGQPSQGSPTPAQPSPPPPPAPSTPTQPPQGSPTIAQPPGGPSTQTQTPAGPSSTEQPPAAPSTTAQPPAGSSNEAEPPHAPSTPVRSPSYISPTIPPRTGDRVGEPHRLHDTARREGKYVTHDAFGDTIILDSPPPRLPGLSSQPPPRFGGQPARSASDSTAQRNGNRVSGNPFDDSVFEERPSPPLTPSDLGLPKTPLSNPEEATDYGVGDSTIRADDSRTSLFGDSPRFGPPLPPRDSPPNGEAGDSTMPHDDTAFGGSTTPTRPGGTADGSVRRPNLFPSAPPPGLRFDDEATQLPDDETLHRPPQNDSSADLRRIFANLHNPTDSMGRLLRDYHVNNPPASPAPGAPTTSAPTTTVTGFNVPSSFVPSGYDIPSYTNVSTIPSYTPAANAPSANAPSASAPAANAPNSNASTSNTHLADAPTANDPGTTSFIVHGIELEQGSFAEDDPDRTSVIVRGIEDTIEQGDLTQTTDSDQSATTTTAPTTEAPAEPAEADYDSDSTALEAQLREALDEEDEPTTPDRPIVQLSDGRWYSAGITANEFARFEPGLNREYDASTPARRPARMPRAARTSTHTSTLPAQPPAAESTAPPDITAPDDNSEAFSPTVDSSQDEETPAVADGTEVTTVLPDSPPRESFRRPGMRRPRERGASEGLVPDRGPPSAGGLAHDEGESCEQPRIPPANEAENMARVIERDSQRAGPGEHRGPNATQRATALSQLLGELGGPQGGETNVPPAASPPQQTAPPADHGRSIEEELEQKSRLLRSLRGEKVDGDQEEGEESEEDPYGEAYQQPQQGDEDEDDEIEREVDEETENFYNGPLPGRF